MPRGMDVDCSIVYENECKEEVEGSSKKYIGQTGRSWYERIKKQYV